MHDATRRDHVLSAAIAAGKFSEQRRTVWAAAYDRDPAGTEALIALLTSPFAPAEPYPRELFPELAGEQRRTHTSGLAPAQVNVAASAACAKVPTPELVADWTRQLFPHAPSAGRITRTGD